MPDTFGIISGISRADRLVGARLDDGTALWLPQGFPYSGDPPPPLSVCAFTDLGGGQYVCQGPLGDGRVILHDDFTQVVGTTPQFGDTPWVQNNAGTVDGLVVPADGQGVVRLSTTAVNGNSVDLMKSDNMADWPTPPAALWCSGRIYTTTTVTSYDFEIGFSDSTVNDAAQLFYDTNAGSVNWEFRVANAGVRDTKPTAVPVVGDTWYDFDIVVVDSLWAALWVNGDGPYIQAGTQAPTAPTSVRIFTRTRSAATVRSRCDWIHVEWFAQATDPRLLDLDRVTTA